MTDHYAVVGNPIAHSVSPQIHAEFARQTGHDLDYVKLLAPLDGFAATVRTFRDQGGKGMNVTLPFKRDAWELAAHDLHGNAVDAGAVNALDFRADTIAGYNTDGTGLVADLERNLGFSIDGKRVLLMGAGGASYGVTSPILEARPRSLTVANRTLHKAASLVGHFTKLSKFASCELCAQGYPQLAGSEFDLIINATSAGLHDEMPPLPPRIFAAGALAYDMVYGKPTPFMKFAAEQGARTADGLGMLVEQAAESFRIWRGVQPDTASVIRLLSRH